MRPTARLTPLFGLLALLFSATASADIPPADTCDASLVGTGCNTAVDGTKPGTCTATKCSRATPDGSVTYDCYRCLPGNGGLTGDEGTGGTGGTAGSAGAGGAAGGAGSAPAPSKGDSGGGGGGCAIHGPTRDGALASLMLVVGLGALAIQRRRRA